MICQEMERFRNGLWKNGTVRKWFVKKWNDLEMVCQEMERFVNGLSRNGIFQDRIIWFLRVLKVIPKSKRVRHWCNRRWCFRSTSFYGYKHVSRSRWFGLIIKKRKQKVTSTGWIRVNEELIKCSKVSQRKRAIGRSISKTILSYCWKRTRHLC